MIDPHGGKACRPLSKGLRAPASGGFLQSAMATAAGVAGGMLAAGAIGRLLGGNASAHAATNPPSLKPHCQ